MAKRAKTLKTKGFSIESRNKFGKVVFRVSILKYEKYKKFRVQATPKGEGKRIDREFNTEEKCHAFIHEWERENPNPYNDSEWRETRTSLTPEQLNDAQIAITMMPTGMTFCELVNANKHVIATKEIRVHAAWEEYRLFNTRTEDNKDGQWRSQKTIHEKSIFFKPVIAKIGNRQIKDIQSDELPQFWQKKGWSDQTRLNRFRAIKAFFSWCKKKKYHFEDLMENQQTPSVRPSTLPRVFTLDEVEKLMDMSLESKFRSIRCFVTLSIYGGLRAGEIHDDWNAETGLKWNHFTLDPSSGVKPEVRIPFIGKKKINVYRYLPPKCVKILKEEKAMGFDVLPKKNGINRWKQLRKACGLNDAGSNVPRRTAISYFYRYNPFTHEPVKDESVMDAQFGNSEDVRKRHYKDGLITIEDAKKFWAC
jgi:integrase